MKRTNWYFISSYPHPRKMLMLLTGPKEFEKSPWYWLEIEIGAMI